MDEIGDLINSGQTIEVVLQGGAPWGFSLKGGAEHHCPLTIAKIDPNGKVSQAGDVKVDDVVVGINGVPCDKHIEAIQLVQTAHHSLSLTLYRGSSATDFRGPKSPDLRKQAQENAAMMKQAMYSTSTTTAQTTKDIGPAPKELAEEKPVPKRVKKRESQSPIASRPKSWHTDYRALSQPDLSRMQSSVRTAEPAHQPRYRNPPPTGYSQFHSASESSFMNTTYNEKTGYHIHGRSTGSLNNNVLEENTDPQPGHVQKKREAFEKGILSQSVDKINEEHNMDLYSRRNLERNVIRHGVNPNLRNIELDIEPAETYPKVVVATHITSAKSKAVLGRVPEMGDQKGQYGSVQDVSIHAVQMPQRQIASSADSSVTRNYAQAHSNLSGYPQTSYVQSTYGVNPHVGGNAHLNDGKNSERRVPPAIPKREDSKTKTQALSEHVKSSSWPVTTSSIDSTNTVTVSQTIHISDLPPVKERRQRSPPHMVPQPNPNQNSNSTTQEIYKAQPVWFDESSKMFSYDESKLLESKSSKFSLDKDDAGPPSPPVRDNDHVQSRERPSRKSKSTDERYLTGDHLIQDYRNFLEQAEKQEQNLKQTIEPGNVLSSDSQSHQPLMSRTHSFQSTTQPQVTESQSLIKTMPTRELRCDSWYQQVEKRRNQSGMSQDPLNFSETEMNQKNISLGQSSDRTWRNPSDSREDEWQQVAKSAAEELQLQQSQQPHLQQPHLQQPHPQQPHPQQPHPQQPNKFSHSRQSSDIDSSNMPRVRAPISPMLLENFQAKQQELRQKTFTQKMEMTNNRHESRDSRKSGIFDGSAESKAEKPREENTLSNTMPFDESNSILGRLKREGSFKNTTLSYDVEGSEGNETSARKTKVPDTKREMRNMGLTEAVFKHDSHTGKVLHYKSESFTHDSRSHVAPADPRLNKTVPACSSHQRTQSIDVAPYPRNPMGRRESMERRSRENSFDDCNIAQMRDYWKQVERSGDGEKGEHKKSKSDSDQHNQVDPQRKKKISDPINKPVYPRKVSDPENKEHIKNALKDFVNHKQRSPPGSMSSPIGSRPPSISGSEQSLLRSGLYTSDSSLASYSSARHYGQDSISSTVSSSFSQPLHQPQDSGFGSNSDISQVRSPHSPPQTGVISPKDVRTATILSKQHGSASVSRTSSMSSQPGNEPRDRRRSHQPRRSSERDFYQRQNRIQHPRMSLDSNLPNNKNQQEKLRQGGVRSPPDRLQQSPTKQMSPSPPYNVHNAERKAITRVQEEETTREGTIVYHSLQQESTEASHFKFPPSKGPEQTRTSPKSSSTFSPTSNNQTGELELSPPPPPTPLSPWDGKDMELPPPPAELVFETERSSPPQAGSGETVGLTPQEGSMPLMAVERITPSTTQNFQQAPSEVLKVQIETAPLAKVDDTTPSISPNSVSGTSSSDIHDFDLPTSLQQAPNLPSLRENIQSTNKREPSLNLNLPQQATPLSNSATEAEPAVDSEEEEGVDVCDSPNIFDREQAKTDKELEQLSDPLLKWVLQSLTPDRAALSDLFPLPKSKRSRSVGGTIRMTNMEATPSKSENEIMPEPRSPSECVHLVLSNSRYLQISPAKAIILKRAKTMNNSDDLGNNNMELRKTQEELVDRISKKLEDIKDLQKEVSEEMSNLEDMGRQVMESVKAKCKASEYNKCNMYIADIERVTRLLLSLSRRLSKVESVLGSMENSEEEEKANLEKLKETILSKYQDAKVLKEGITRRHPTNSTMLLNKISNEQHDNFSYYVQMLPRLLIMGQELEDKVKLGEEQLEALAESLKQMSISGSEGGSGTKRDTNGNVHGLKEDGDIVSAAASISSQEDLNSNATSSYC